MIFNGNKPQLPKRETDRLININSNSLTPIRKATCEWPKKNNNLMFDSQTFKSNVQI